MKRNFGYQKGKEVFIFVILDNKCRVKDAHTIFQPKNVPNTAYDNFKS